jgi:predicted phage gp36 major capsid-like protein
VADPGVLDRHRAEGDPAAARRRQCRRRGWLSGKVGDKFGRFENAEFVTGAANKIRGFMLGYTQTSDTGSGVTWGTVGYKSPPASAATSRRPIRRQA